MSCPPHIPPAVALDAIADAIRLTDLPATASQGGSVAGVEWSAGRIMVLHAGALFHFRVADHARSTVLTRESVVVRAPIPGVVAELPSSTTPEAGATLVVLEAMKTWTRVLCPDLSRAEAVVLEYLVASGDPVVEGQPLAILRLAHGGECYPEGVEALDAAPSPTQIVSALALGAPLPEEMIAPFRSRCNDSEFGALSLGCTLDALAAIDRRPLRRNDGGLSALPPAERALAWRVGGVHQFEPAVRRRMEAYSERWRAIGCTSTSFQARMLERCARYPDRLANLVSSCGPAAIDQLSAHSWRPDPVESSELMALYQGLAGTPDRLHAWTSELTPRDTRIFDVSLRRVLAGGAETAAEAKAKKLIGRALHPAFICGLLLDDLGEAELHEHPAADGRNIGVKIATVKTHALHFVLVLSDPTVAFASLSNDECAAVVDALDLAIESNLPVVWFAMSSGARIDRETGTENLDGTAHTLRRIVEFGEAGGRMYSVVVGPCVGAQAYWLAASGVTLASRGILVMTPAGSMVLSGTKALEYSGSYGAPDERAIGGFCTAGSQGHAAFYAEDIPAAWAQVRAMLELGTASKTDTSDDVARSPADVVLGVLGESAAMLLGPNAHPARREQYAVRPLMQALFDNDSPVLFPWDAWADARQAVVARGRIGGVCCTLIGVDQQSSSPEWAHSAARGSQFHAGTLYPESSRKIARAIRAAADEPVILLANLAGFDSSPESLLDGQLGAGAEIAGAVATRTNPLLVCVLTRYHGGAFVVFSKRLGADVTSIALQGSFASVIGGVPAAAIVFSRDVDARVEAAGGGPGARGDALKAVGQAFDEHHSVDRALRMGSIDRIIELDQLRASLAEFTRGAVRDGTT